MKRALMLFLTIVYGTVVFSQYDLRPSYLGFKAGVNYSTNFQDPDQPGYKYDYKTGFAGGVFYNIAAGKKFSIQPELLYSQMGSEMSQSISLPNTTSDLKLDYLSLPILFKFNPSWRFSVFAGPQFDYLLGSRLQGKGFNDDLEKLDIAGTAGLEFWPLPFLGLYGRYIHGFININEDNPIPSPLANTPITSEIFNRGFQVGVILGIRVKPKPKDADLDGILDPDDKCPTVPGTAKYQGCPVPDTDADGINDDNDRCPTTPGLAKYNGCPIPDTDNDGVNDEADKCVTVPGLAKYEGCPIPDTDRDGVNDEEDKCPTVPGLAKYLGCPIPDRDGDGINDEEDRCPDHIGVPEMKGCPKPDYRAHGVTFATNKAILTANGKKELDRLVDFMTTYPNLNVTLVGYTDSTGTDKINNPLSEKRAESSKAYLVSKGIDESRIMTTGRGSSNPVESNKTAAGRALNRRIEVEVQ